MPATLPESSSKPQAHKCFGCQILSEQLKEARLREQRKDRQIERLMDQTGMVIQSKFETFKLSGEKLPESTGGPLPLAALTDVEDMSDEQFLKTVSETTH